MDRNRLSFLGSWLGTLCVTVLAVTLGCSVSSAQEPCRVQYVDAGPSLPCSAVAVGRNVALTASHCLDGSPNWEITLLPTGGGARKGTCSPHPSSSIASVGKKGRVDLALCHFGDPFPEEEIETVSTERRLLSSGTTLTFTGNGCGHDPCGGHASGCRLGVRSGRFRVWKQPSPDDVTFTAIGLRFRGESYVSSGDSGGPVCTQSGDHVLGIVRAGCQAGRKWRSSITSLAAGDTARWMCKWVCEEPAVRRIRGLQCGGCAG